MPSQKTCTKCNETKPAGEFNKRALSRDGLSYICKVCDGAKAAEWYASNPERGRANASQWRAENPHKVRAHNAAWYAANLEKARVKGRASAARWAATNPDKARAREAIWRTANPEKVRASSAKWRAANPERARQAATAWLAANPEKNRAKAARRRASKLQAAPIWADELAIKAFYGACPEGHHVDHAVPLKGKNVCGLHTLANLQYLTAKDNLSKGNRFHVADDTHLINEARV